MALALSDHYILISDGSRSTFCGLGWVSHLWFGFESWKFPPKMSNFSIFSFQVNNYLFGSGQKVPGSKAGRPLINCGSKVSSGRVRDPSLILTTWFSHRIIFWGILLYFKAYFLLSLYYKKVKRKNIHVGIVKMLQS